MVLRFSDLVVFAMSGGAIFLCSLFGSDERGKQDSSITDFKQSENTPPVVKITEPKNNSVHSLNSLVRYSISVSDKEDGESKYDEVPAGKIFLEIRFISGSPDSRNFQKQKPSEESIGLSRIKNLDCFTCHQFKTRLIGPSFLEIATRYSKTPDARQILASRITDGSQAVWGEAIMPAHPGISPEGSQEIVDWILKNGLNENLNYLSGNEGSFRTEIPSGVDEGFFVLRAIYSDKGLPGKPTETLTGQDVVVIRAE